jgi:hypothetical protein
VRPSMRTSAAVHEDPAMRKAPRTSRTSASSAAVATDMSMSIEPMSTMEEPGTEVAVASSYAYTTIDQSNDFGDVESVPDYKPANSLPPAPVPEFPPPSSTYSAPAMGVTPVIHPPPEPLDQYTFSDNQQIPPQPETYATGSTEVMSPAVDGDTVQIQVSLGSWSMSIQKNVSFVLRASGLCGRRE